MHRFGEQERIDVEVCDECVDEGGDVLARGEKNEHELGAESGKRLSIWRVVGCVRREERHGFAERLETRREIRTGIERCLHQLPCATLQGAECNRRQTGGERERGVDAVESEWRRRSTADAGTGEEVAGEQVGLASSRRVRDVDVGD